VSSRWISGPDLSHSRIQQDLKELDGLCGELIETADAQGAEIIVVSEYGITEVVGAVDINRHLRRAGLLEVRQESGMEQLDAGASAAFAVADHQLAHVYINQTDRIEEIGQLLLSIDGVESVLAGEELAQAGLGHARSGDLVVISEADRWFSYYYWLDEDKAPDYSRTVDIHRKPGYDPVELFVNPDIRFPMLKVASVLGGRKLGFNRMMDVISPSATHLVKGSHGRPTDDVQEGPVLISSNADVLPEGSVHATDFKALVLAHQFG